VAESRSGLQTPASGAPSTPWPAPRSTRPPTGSRSATAGPAATRRSGYGRGDVPLPARLV